MQLGALQPLFILSLAELAVPEWDEDQTPSLTLAESTANFSRMEAAMLKLIDSELDARELLQLTPMEAATRVCEELGVLYSQSGENRTSSGRGAGSRISMAINSPFRRAKIAAPVR